jgi:ABC-type oligopeptide transport system substrate-binding subunit
MRLQARISVSIVAVAALALLAGAGTMHAQAPAGQSSSSQSSSSQSSGDQATTPQSTPDQTSNGGRYISIDPLALVRYDNKFDVSLGMAYDHMKAGPNLLQGSNLGGLDLSGAMWLSKHWAVEASGRGYLGTSGAAPNAPYNIKGPFVQEYFFTAGPEWLGPHNKHGAIMAHVLVGGVDGMFEKDLLGQSPSVVGFYNNQLALAGIVGGHFDLNRSARWVFRITPDAVITRYGINYGSKITQTDVNFAISVGLQYKFKKKR